MADDLGRETVVLVVVGWCWCVHTTSMSHHDEPQQVDKAFIVVSHKAGKSAEEFPRGFPSFVWQHHLPGEEPSVNRSVVVLLVLAWAVCLTACPPLPKAFTPNTAEEQAIVHTIRTFLTA
jgi:hypothetical protein